MRLCTPLLVGLLACVDEDVDDPDEDEATSEDEMSIAGIEALSLMR